MSDDVVGSSVFELTTDSEQFVQGLDDAQQAAEQSNTKIGGVFDAIGKRISGVGVLLTALMSGPLAAFLGMAYKTGLEWEEVMFSFRKSLGATGERAEALGDAVKHIAVAVHEDWGTIADVVGVLEQKLGLTGGRLEANSKQIIELAHLLGTEAAPLAEKTADAFLRWGIASDEQSNALNFLYKIVQQTGVSMSTLLSMTTNFAEPMRAFGVSFGETAEMVGQFDKAGLNVSKMMGGMRLALLKLAKGKDGIGDPIEAFKEITKDIKNAGTEAEATALAVKFFGKSGIDMAAAIRSGKLDIDALSESLVNSHETISQAYLDTLSWHDKLGLLGDRIKVSMIPAGEGMTEMVGNLWPQLEKATGWVTDFNLKLFGTPGAARNAAIGMSILVTTVGPQLMALGGIISNLGELADIFRASLILFSAPALILVAVFAAVATAAWLIFDSWEDLRRTGMELVTWVKNHWKQIWNDVGEQMDNVREKVTELRNTIHEWLADVLPRLKSWLRTEIPEALGNLKDKLSDAWDWFLDDAWPRIQATWDGIVDVFNTVKDWIVDDFWPTLVTAWENFTETIDSLRDPIANIWGAVMDAWDKFSTWVAETFGSIIGAVADFIGDWISLFDEYLDEQGDLYLFIEDVWDKIQVIYQTVSDFIAEEIIPALKTAFETFTDDVLPPFIAGLEIIATFFSGIFHDVIDAFVNDWWPALSEAFTRLVEEVWPHVIEGASQVAGFIEEIVFAVADLIEGMANLWNALGPEGQNFVKMGLVVAAAAAAFVLLAFAVTSVVPVWVLLGGAIVLLVGYWDDLLERFPALQAVQNVVVTSLGLIQDALGFVLDIIEKILVRVADDWGNFSTIIEAPLIQAQTTLEWFVGIIEGVWKILHGLFTGDWEEMWDGLTDIVESTLTFIIDTIKNGKDLLWSAAQVLWSAFKDAMDELFGDVLGDVAQFAGDVIGAVTDRVTDMYNGAVDFFNGIGDALDYVWDLIVNTSLGLFIGDILSAIRDWGGDVLSAAGEVWAKISEAFGLAIDLLTGVAGFIATKVTDVISAFAGWLTAAAQVGRDMIDKIIAGLGEVWYKVTAWISDHMPSLSDIGGWLHLPGSGGDDASAKEIPTNPAGGLTFGSDKMDSLSGAFDKMKDFMDKVISYAKDKGKDALEAAQSLGSAISSIAGALSNSVDALKALQDNKLQTVNMGKLESFFDAIGDIFRRVREMAVYTKEQNERVAEFSKAVSAVVGAVANAVQVLVFLGEVKLHAIKKGTIHMLFDEIKDIFRAFRNLGVLAKDQSERMSDFSDSVKSIVGAVGDALDVVLALSGEKLKAVPAGNVGRLFSVLHKIIEDVVRESKAFKPEAIEAAAVFGDAVGPIISGLSDAFDLVMQFGEVKRVRLVDFIGPFFNELEVFIRQMIDKANGFKQKSLEKAAILGQLLDPILQALSGALDMLVHFAEVKKLGPITNGFVSKFFNEMESFIRMMISRSADFKKENLIRAAELGSMLDPILSGLDGVLDTLVHFAEVKRLGPISLGFVNRVFEDLSMFVRYMIEASHNFKSKALIAAAMFGSVLEPIFSPLKTVLEVLVSMEDVKQLKPLGKRMIDTMFDDIKIIVRHMIDAAAGFKPKSLAAAAFLGSVIAPVFAPITSVLETLKALNGADIQRIGIKKIDAFFDNVTLIMKYMVEAGKKFKQTGLEAAAMLASVIGIVFEPLQKAFDFLTAEGLGDYVKAPMKAISLMIDDMIDVMQMLIRRINDIPQEALKRAGEASGSMMAVLSVMSATFDMLTKLSTSEITVGGLRSMKEVLDLALDLEEVAINRMSRLDTVAAGRTAEIANAITAVLDMLMAYVNTANAIRGGSGGDDTGGGKTNGEIVGSQIIIYANSANDAALGSTIEDAMRRVIFAAGN